MSLVFPLIQLIVLGYAFGGFIDAHLGWRWAFYIVVIPGLVLGLLIASSVLALAVMGYADPRAIRGSKPFTNCDNHLVMAEQAGLGTADLSQIDVRGMTIEKARCPFG